MQQQPLIHQALHAAPPSTENELRTTLFQAMLMVGLAQFVVSVWWFFSAL